MMTMEAEKSVLALSVSFGAGVLLGLIISWMEPFTETVYTDAALTLAVFSLGIFIGRFFFRRRLSWLPLAYTGLAVLLFFSGQAILYKLVTYFYWGWTVAFLYVLLAGILCEIRITLSNVAAIAAGILFFQLVPSVYLLYMTCFLMGLSFWYNNFSSIIKYLTIVLILVFIMLGNYTSVELYGRQNKFADLIIYSDFTRTNKIDVTTWRGNYWYYVNNQNRISTVDDYLYYEPLVHPAFALKDSIRNVLILGGEFGGALKEVNRYQTVRNITLVPEDPMLIDKVQSNFLFEPVSGGCWADPRLKISEKGLFEFLTSSDEYFDVIIADLPDPSGIKNNQYYTKEFYELCNKLLRDEGIFVTQAGSPYFATKAFYGIDKTIRSAGFYTRYYHNQILTLGEWGWILGVKEPAGLENIGSVSFDKIRTKWINQEAMKMMLSFGKINTDTTGTKINTIKAPVTYRYYTTGNWSF